MLRSILKFKLKDHISLSEMFGKTGEKEVGKTIIKLKFHYEGYHARESNFKWNKLVTIWLPIKKCKRGRPVTSWVDEIGWVASPRRYNRAMNRLTWSELWKAHA